jgi:hypothetical protein
MKVVAYVCVGLVLLAADTPETVMARRPSAMATR